MVNKKTIIEILERIPVSAKTRNLIFHLNEAIKEIEKNENIKEIKKKTKNENENKNFQNLTKKSYDQIINTIENLVEEEKRQS